ncbi:MAG: 23S rRNA (uracil(1939)-C(5))-methyltransferase RlmD [Oscillospiraceae bacterium]
MIEKIKIEKNETYKMEITGMTDEGDGVGRVEGQAVFVPYTIVGEVVLVLIVKVLKNYAFGKLIEVITPSKNRIKAECEHFYRCGGCTLLHMDYEAELQYKQQKVEDCLQRIGKIDVNIAPIIGCNQRDRYRNKAQFPVTPQGVGIYAKRSHNVVNMNDCIIQKKFNSDILECVRKWMSDFNILPYDEGSDKGTVRHVYTRCGDSGIIVCIVTRSSDIPHKSELVNTLKEVNPNIIGIVQNVNEKVTNVVLGNVNKTLYGEDFIIDAIGDVKFKISIKSFYQVNKSQTEKLYSVAKAVANLSGDEIVWDMYCGIGTIGQFMADSASTIVGVEIVESAVANAKENAKINRLNNTEYYQGAAEKVAPSLIKKGLIPDVVVLDPPRKGCDEALLKTIALAKAKKIIYISCKPSTLARDLKYLEQNGYKTKKATPVDMFPATGHVECVVCLHRVEG